MVNEYRCRGGYKHIVVTSAIVPTVDRISLPSVTFATLMAIFVNNLSAEIMLINKLRFLEGLFFGLLRDSVR
ncbi:hypothetical protein SVI_1628 [Shewanella violacea DSS12]|uniref:Uncharacterized protein n=1 Tax=Shewanella violacea (strain JCM 10179 / CIP 106290 / LMG 19151 / DSS12) TaxID=637905 RepID=D4ZIV0_SHEVD|nr:hypothetical protein SVI_1628 [Shewanella violacea DSS12]